MLRFALVFAILAIIAGFCGFYGLQDQLAWFARVLFFLFLVLFIVSLFFGRRAPVV